MSNQNCLTILGKQHQVRFPMAGLTSLVDVGRAPIDRYSLLDTVDDLAASASTPTALSFCSRKIMAPAVVLGSTDLRVDKPIDRFVADDRTSFFLVQPSGNLGGRPTILKPFENLFLKRRPTQQSTASPAATFGLLLCVGRLIANLSATVALKFSRYSRWRAIHSCRDLAHCFPGLVKSGKCTALFKRKLFIASSHCNTLYRKCCTWFVNLGNPVFFNWTPAFAGMTNVFIAALSSNDNRLRTLKEHCIGIEKEFGNHSLTRKSRLYRTPKSLHDSRSQRRLSHPVFQHHLPFTPSSFWASRRSESADTSEDKISRVILDSFFAWSITSRNPLSGIAPSALKTLAEAS